MKQAIIRTITQLLKDRAVGFFIEPTTYGMTVNVSCLGEIIPPAFLPPEI